MSDQTFGLWIPAAKAKPELQKEALYEAPVSVAAPVSVRAPVSVAATVLSPHTPVKELLYSPKISYFKNLLLLFSQQGQLPKGG